MLIFWPQRLVILATPKTGTTSLEAALESMADVAVLRPWALKHTTAAAYQQHLAPYLETAAGEAFRTVALIREPADWLGSWYRAHLFEADEEENRPGFDSFAAFVEAHLSPTPPKDADVGRQADYLVAGVDHLFRYDRFDAFTEFLERELDCELILPRLRASPVRDLTLPEELRDRLRRERAEDYGLYDAAN